MKATKISRKTRSICFILKIPISLVNIILVNIIGQRNCDNVLFTLVHYFCHSLLTLLLFRPTYLTTGIDN